MNARIIAGVYLIWSIVLTPVLSGEIFLPGMQPEEAGIEFAKVLKSDFHASGNLCGTCHDISNPIFAEYLCEPVGKTYANGQYRDDLEFDIPQGTKKVRVRLMYQSMSWEYLKFLAEENKTDDWGKKLYSTWTRTGKCPPTTIAQIEKPI